MNGTDPGAFEAFDLVAQIVEHEADLALETLAEHHADPTRTKDLQALESRAPTFDENPPDHFCGVGGIERFVQRDIVFLLDAMRRMRQFLREIPIVGQQEESLAFFVETADMKERREFRRKEIVNRPASALVGPRDHETAGFVKEHVDRASDSDNAAMDADIVAVGNNCRELIDTAAIDHDRTRGDEFFAGPSGPEARSGKKTVQPHA